MAKPHIRAHIQEERLERYAMGALAKESTADIEEHLLECPLCQERLSGADKFLTEFRAAAVQLERSTVQPKRVRPHARVLWVGAAAAALFMTVLISRQPGATNSPPATVIMESLRGPASGAHVAANKPFLLSFDITPPATPVAHEIEIVNVDGNEVLTTSGDTGGGRLTASISKIPRGTYWVRVFRKQDTRVLIAEYALKAE